MFAAKAKRSFEEVAKKTFSDLGSHEALIIGLRAEETVFVRFNNNKVRQNTSVEQIKLTFQLQSNQRTTSIAFSLTGQVEVDLARAQRWLNVARQECQELPLDPYQVPVINNGESEVSYQGQLLAPLEVADAVTRAAQGSDLAGLYCSGVVISANKNSAGQSHWFSTESFFVDYSLYNGEKAVKSSYAGTHWDQSAFEKSVLESKHQLALMDRPKKTIPPGAYKTYLAPAAVAELLSLFGWGAMGFADYKKGNSSFKKLADGEKSFSPLFHYHQNFALGLTPRFNLLGELAPESLELIGGGKLKNFLVSSRSAKEFGGISNNAPESESPRSVEVLPGALKKADILKELGTGLYLSNLHYLNWSDRQTARITGMTRYACFWVENGEIIAPIADLRFDESLFDCLGENLLAVTDFQEIETETGTYENRSLGGSRLPGMLIRDFKFTL